MSGGDICGRDSELGLGGQCSKVYIFSYKSSVLKKAIYIKALLGLIYI